MLPGCLLCGGVLRTTTAGELLFSWGDSPSAVQLRDVVREYGQHQHLGVCDSCGVWFGLAR